MKMKNYSKKILLGCTTGLLLFAAVAQAADPTGTWTWSSPGRGGGPDRVTTLVLKVEGSNLAGKISVPGRDAQPVETPIASGKVDGDNISFDLVREFNGNSTTNKYSGVVAADKITGKIESSRDGQTQSRDWEAKRSAESK
jgi:hypothetical protein